MMKSKPQYETIIQANRNWFVIDWKDIWCHRDLLFMLVWREFVAKYKQTVLGPLWYIIQPLVTTVVFTLIFGNFLKISTDGLPPQLFYFCALIPWNYFAISVSSISTSFTTNAGIFTKVYFPRLIIPFSILISNLLMMIIQLATFLGIYLYFIYFTPQGEHINPNLAILLLPFIVIYTAIVSLAVGLWIAALTVKYRDFQYAMTFLVHLWMYATPVIYPVSAVPEKWRILLGLNPLTGIVETFRYAFFGVATVQFELVFLSIVITIVLLISGLFFFNKVERTFVDTI